LHFSIGSLSRGALDPQGVYLGSLDAAEPAKLLLPGATQARYANGHVLFVQNGTLMAQPFELESKELRGAPLPLVEDVKLATAGATGDTVSFSVSDNGVLVYQAAPRTESRPVSFDRAGKQLAVLTAPADYSDVALSPDGAHLAVSVRDPARFTRDLWLYDMDGSRGQRLTFDPADEFAPVWPPDGTRLLFSSMTKGLVDLHVKEVNSAGDALHLEVDNIGLGRYAADWSRDGATSCISAVVARLRGAICGWLLLRALERRARFWIPPLSKRTAVSPLGADGLSMSRTKRASWRCTSIGFPNAERNASSRRAAAAGRDGREMEARSFTCHATIN